MDGIFSEYYFRGHFEFCSEVVGGLEPRTFLVPGLAPAYRIIQNGREGKHFFHAWIN